MYPYHLFPSLQFTLKSVYYFMIVFSGFPFIFRCFWYSFSNDRFPCAVIAGRVNLIVLRCQSRVKMPFEGLVLTMAGWQMFKIYSPCIAEMIKGYVLPFTPLHNQYLWE